MKTPPSQVDENFKESKVITYIVVGLVGLLPIALWCSTSKTFGSKPKPSPIHMQVGTATSPCGQSIFDVAEVVYAASYGDVFGDVGISQREGVFLLDKGTKVEAGEPVGEMRFVEIAAGIHRGETCWVPVKYLRLDH